MSSAAVALGIDNELAGKYLVLFDEKNGKT